MDSVLTYKSVKCNLIGLSLALQEKDRNKIQKLIYCTYHGIGLYHVNNYRCNFGYVCFYKNQLIS